MRGHLSYWLFAECAKCGATLDVAYAIARPQATQKLLKRGWHTRRIDGLWICEKCKPKVGPHETA